MLRPRSLSRSKVVKISDAFPSGECLDPIALLDDLLNKVENVNLPLAVNLTDGENSVSFLLSIFISKEYEVLNGKVKFGLKKLNIKNLKIEISFKIELEDS
jgi:hypothetical protein